MWHAWEFEGLGILHSSMVATTIFYPARVKQMMRCYSLSSLTICLKTSWAQPRAPTPYRGTWPCSRVCSSSFSHSPSSTSLAVSSHSGKSCAALSSWGSGGFGCPSYTGVLGSPPAAGAATAALALPSLSVLSSVAMAPSMMLKHSFMGS